MIGIERNQASMGILGDDWVALRSAVAELERPSFAARLSSVIGSPVEAGLKRLPPKWNQRLEKTTDAVLRRTLNVAVRSLPTSAELPPEGRHRRLGMMSGAVGGYLGLPGVLLELPLTTMVILRSIAATAAAEGEDLTSLDARLACMEVFALGGPRSSDDAAETGYFGLRVLMARQLAAASEAVAARGIGAAELPALVVLVRAIAARFGVVVSEKTLFQMLPILGAAGGALINAIFVDHFEQIARGHFTVRRLERKYGTERIREAYASAVEDFEFGSDPASRPDRPAASGFARPS